MVLRVPLIPITTDESREVKYLGVPLRSTKARVVAILESDQQPYIDAFSGFGFQPAGIGIDGELEINDEGLDLWKRNLLLPEGYTLLRVYYGMNTHKWSLVLESDDMPRMYINHPVEEHEPFKEIIPVVNILPGEGQNRTIQITHLQMEGAK